VRNVLKLPARESRALVVAPVDVELKEAAADWFTALLKDCVAAEEAVWEDRREPLII
jgi:hypothetical protein